MALTQWTKAVEWLAAAAREPRLCKRDWQYSTTGIHLLAAGRFWDVLIVPACLGLRTADILAGLPRLEPGPVLLDSRRQHVGFFLPPDPASIWAGHNIRYLTTGSWIATPAPHCRWGDLSWICPPDGSGILNAPAALELALHMAMDELARNHGSSHDRAAPHRADTPHSASLARGKPDDPWHGCDQRG
ncbi:hypothetical protein [Streptomyces sp. Ru71]|uniref:hypothetical protein n=1 Tax=Streptomyces sp. Ru71 TaxID=2080746 RepID=UPI0015E3BEDE|nr:hypothetical protein [Streptomyces sp. Ru71]